MKSETALILGAQPQHARAQELAERASAAAEGVGQELPPGEGATAPAAAVPAPEPTPATTPAKAAARRRSRRR